MSSHLVNNFINCFKINPSWEKIKTLKATNVKYKKNTFIRNHQKFSSFLKYTLLQSTTLLKRKTKPEKRRQKQCRKFEIKITKGKKWPKIAIDIIYCNALLLRKPFSIGRKEKCRGNENDNHFQRNRNSI